MRELTITTLTHARDSADCEDGFDCPAVRTVAEHPDKYFVVLTEVTDPAILQAFAPFMGPGEVLGTSPCAVIDAVGRDRP